MQTACLLALPLVVFKDRMKMKTLMPMRHKIKKVSRNPKLIKKEASRATLTKKPNRISKHTAPTSKAKSLIRCSQDLTGMNRIFTSWSTRPCVKPSWVIGLLTLMLNVSLNCAKLLVLMLLILRVNCMMMIPLRNYLKKVLSLMFLNFCLLPRKP